MNTLVTSFKTFHLAGMAKTAELRIAQAAEQNLSHREFLEVLCEDEKNNRDDNRKKRLFTAAHFPFVKTIEDFDFSFQPSIKKGEILELSTCTFIAAKENIVFTGQPGTGKTHLSVSLGVNALGYGYTVLFTSVWDMIATLQYARADHTYKKKIEYYTKPDLLILDELGYKSMAETTVEDFFEIVTKRYEKKPIIITTNRDYQSWDKIFIDKTLTGAIIDRLIHHCHTVVITGESYRMKKRTV